MIFNANFQNLNLDEKEAKFIDEIVSRSKVKPSVIPAFKKTLENSAKFYNFHKGIYSSAGVMTTSFTETFKSLSMVVSSKFFTSSIINDIATVVPVNTPEGKVFVTTYTYKDDYTAEGIQAGNKLSAKRSKTYGTAAEGANPRRIGVTFTAVNLTCTPRPIEHSYTLQALMNLHTIYTPAQVEEFLNNKFVDVISQKLRDEAEWSIINELITNAGTKEDYTVGTYTDCEGLECEAIKLYNAIDDVANGIYKKTGVKNNILIIGRQAYSILRNLDVKKYNFDMNGNIITDLARNVIGTLDKVYKVIYDPWIEDKIVITTKSDVYDVAPIVYGTFIPLAVTPEFIERNLEIYRIVYTVDGWTTVFPDVVGVITLK